MNLRYKGKRCIIHARCSTNEQPESVGQQCMVLRQFALTNEMIVVGEVRVEGLSASQTANRPDLDQLLQRKRDKNDYDIILVQDFSRLTRGGPEHGMKLIYEFDQLGVQIVTAANDIPEGDYAWLQKSLEFCNSRATAKAISLAVSRGWMINVIAGNCPYTAKIPYAIDRLYVNTNGDDSFVIRNNPDRSQDKYLPGGLEHVSHFEPGGHYRKQRNERVTLVPGCREHVEVVRLIFQRHYVEQHGSHVIARELNDKGIPSPKGKQWYTFSVQAILDNTIYIGVGTANRIAEGTFFNRSTSGVPTPAIKPKYTNGRRHREYRDPEHWSEIPYPALEAAFLDESLHALVTSKQRRRHTKRAMGMAGRPGGSRHKRSRYILTGLIKAKQEGRTLVGFSGKKGNRYYRASKASGCPITGSIWKKALPAGPLELAVLRSLRESTSALPEVEEEVRRCVAAASKQLSNVESRLKEEKQKEAKIDRAMDCIIDQFAEFGSETITKKLAPLKLEKHAVRSSIQELQERAKQKSFDPERALIRVREMMKQLGAKSPADPGILRTLLHTHISYIVVDVVTRVVEWEVRLPMSAFLQYEGCEKGSVVTSLGSQSCNQNNRVPAIKIGVFRLKFFKDGRDTRLQYQRIDTPVAA